MGAGEARSPAAACAGAQESAPTERFCHPVQVQGPSSGARGQDGNEARQTPGVSKPSGMPAKRGRRSRSRTGSKQERPRPGCQRSAADARSQQAVGNANEARAAIPFTYRVQAGTPGAGMPTRRGGRPESAGRRGRQRSAVYVRSQHGVGNDGEVR